MSKIAGVIGWPVSHSLSPKLHGFWLKTHGINGLYNAVAVEPQALGDYIKKLPHSGWRGVNVTLPHKETVMPMLDYIDATAKAIGAVNTIVVKDGKLHGSNTDAYGFMENIRPHITHKNTAVVLGAGGAARAVCYALANYGFSEIILLNRTSEKAQAIARSFDRTSTAPWHERSDVLSHADLLVNATSLGMTGKEPLDVDIKGLPHHALVTDIVYKPLVTPLLHAARAQGNKVVDGLGMLLHQAVPGFEAWFGVKPAVTQELRQQVLSGVDA